jgi:hypothetical protein
MFFGFFKKIKIDIKLIFFRDQTRPSTPENNIRMTESGPMYVFPFESNFGKMHLMKF